MAGSGEQASGSGEQVAGSGEHVSGSGEHVSGSGEQVSGSGEQVSGSGEQVSGDVAGQPARASEQQWLRAFAAELGVEPPDETARQELLGLAGVAAHASERTAAPLSCWLAARAGVSPAEALALATAVADRLAAEGSSPPGSG